MNLCGTTRLFVPGFMVGFAVATFTGNDLLGFIAAALGIGSLFVLQKLRGGEVGCPVPQSDE